MDGRIILKGIFKEFKDVFSEWLEKRPCDLLL
jgi:hypothetical protein